MDILWEFIKVFIVGGLICVIAQILIDKTKLTPARILVTFVVAGVFLTASSGATVPLSGFGYTLAKGVETAVEEDGWLGILTGGISSCAAGIAAAIFFGYLAALISKPRAKK